MFGEKCYHSLIKKYVSLFGSVFNDIVIERVDSSNATVQTIKVPIGYGPKEKYITMAQFALSIIGEKENLTVMICQIIKENRANLS